MTKKELTHYVAYLKKNDHEQAHFILTSEQVNFLTRLCFEAASCYYRPNDERGQKEATMAKELFHLLVEALK